MLGGLLLLLLPTDGLLVGGPGWASRNRHGRPRCSDPADPADDFLPVTSSEIVTDREALLGYRAGYALIFNAGQEAEGIYSRQTSGRDTVLVFEHAEAAERYANMLAAQDFPEASVVRFEIESLLEFAEMGGHELGLVPSTSLVVPPAESVDSFEWSPGESAEAREPAADAEALEAARAKLENLL